MRPLLTVAGLIILLLTVLLFFEHLRPNRTLWQYSSPKKIRQLAVGNCGEVIVTTSEQITLVDSHGRHKWSAPNVLCSSGDSLSHTEYQYSHGTLIGIHNNGMLACFKDGQMEWRHLLDNGLHGAKFVNTASGYKPGLLWISANRNLREGSAYGINSAGQTVKQVSLQRLHGNRPATLALDGSFYHIRMRSFRPVGEGDFAYTEDFNHLCRTLPDGTLAWSYAGVLRPAYDVPVILPSGDIAVGNPKGLHILNPKGQLVLKSDTLRIGLTLPLVSRTGRVYLASKRGIVEIDSKGTELLQAAEHVELYHPCITSDGYIVAIREDPGRDPKDYHDDIFLAWCYTPNLKLRWNAV